MPGVIGRSGKATTLEAKLAKAEGGRKAGRGRPLNGPALPPPTGDPTADDPVERLGKPMTWGDELKRQQVEGERIQNRRREVEVQRAEVELAKAQDERDLTNGKRLTKEQHRAAVQSVVELILASVPILTDAALSQHPPEQHPTVRHALTKAEAAFRLAAMAAIKQG